MRVLSVLRGASARRGISSLARGKNLVRGLSTAAQPSPSPVENAHTEFRQPSSISMALKPREIVAQLEKYIVGQAEAKRAVAIALRNRWRRHQLSEDLKPEVIPKNILMIGPTGCGKTEIARRIAKLSQAPFIKVEATKFTEVGFHGRDVDQIIRDLLDVSLQMTRKKIKDQLKDDVEEAVESQLIEALIGDGSTADRADIRNLLRQGLCEERIVAIDVPMSKPADKSLTIETTNQNALTEISRALTRIGGKKLERKHMTVAEARGVLEEIQNEKMMEQYDIPKQAIAAVEESGIVFIDEIDKLVSTGDYRGADASSEGVQRDLLPLIEGCAISTKYGNVNTDYILFIASGAFHQAKPSDLLAELQGRLPIRVNLQGLTEADLYRILTEPEPNLIRQQKEMLKTENVHLEFTDAAIREIAKIAAEVNKSVENIGARRLHTVIERIVEEVSFDAPDKQEGSSIVIDEEYVRARVGDLLKHTDLKKFIL